MKDKPDFWQHWFCENVSIGNTANHEDKNLLLKHQYTSLSYHCKYDRQYTKPSSLIAENANRLVNFRFI